MNNPENIEDAEFHFENIVKENAGKLAEIRSKTDAKKSLSELEREAEKYAKGINRKAFISIENGTTTGFVQIIANETELPAGSPRIDGLDTLAHLARIAVDKDHRGRGVAKKLLSRAEDWAKGQGKDGMWLGYLADNLAAEKLYKGAGYEDVAEFIDTEKQKMRRIAIKHF